MEIRLELSAKHPLELLSHLHGAVVLVLRNFSRIEQLLYLFLRVSVERIFELLKPLNEAVLIHIVIQLVHSSPPSNVPVFARFQPVAR